MKAHCHNELTFFGKHKFLYYYYISLTKLQLYAIMHNHVNMKCMYKPSAVRIHFISFHFIYNIRRTIMVSLL